MKKTACRKKLSNKIKRNMKETRYKSREQAIAVSYSQILKKYPKCKRFFKKSKRPHKNKNKNKK